MQKSHIHSDNFNLAVLLLAWLFITSVFLDNEIITLVLVGCMFVCFILKNKIIQTTVISKVDYCIYFICLAEIVCCTTSIYAANSISLTLHILYFAVFYFFIRNFIHYYSQIYVLFIGIALIALFLSIMTIINFILFKTEFTNVGITSLSDVKQYFHPSGKFSNDWSTILLCLLPFSFIAAIQVKPKWAWAFILSGGANIAALLMCFSRGAYISLFVFLIALFVFVFIFKRSKIRRLIIVCCSTLALAVIAVYPQKHDVLKTCAIIKTESQRKSMESRFTKWNSCLQIFKYYPITGVGGGNYALAAQKLNVEHGATTRSTNTYLQIVAEKGIFGVFAYGGLFVLTLISAFKRLKNGNMEIIVFSSFLFAFMLREVTFSSLFNDKTILCIFVITIIILTHNFSYKRYDIFKIQK